jgi:hypothetical protein
LTGCLFVLKGMLTFDPVDINSVDWAAEINNYPERTIFQTPAWLSFIAKTQNAQPVFAALREGQQGLGYFTGLMVCKFGIRILGSPFPGPGFASGRAGGQGRRGRWKRPFEFSILAVMNIVGIFHSYSDPSAALVRDGQVVAFVEDVKVSAAALYKTVSAALARCELLPAVRRLGRNRIEGRYKRRPPVTWMSRVLCRRVKPDEDL